MTSDLVLLRGTAGWGTGKFGQCVTGGVYTVTTGTDLDSPAGTIEMWVTSTAASTKVAFGSCEGEGLPSGIFIGHNAGGYAFAQVISANPFTSSIIINDGAWHHLALTVDGSGAKLWVDGALAASGMGTSLEMGSAVTTLGAYGLIRPTIWDWTGSIDELRISSVVRYTAAFTPPTQAFSVDSITTALYHLDGNGTFLAGSGIALDDPRIIYSPGNWDVTATRAKSINPGAYIRFSATTTSVTLGFDLTGLSTWYPTIRYRIDSGAWVPVTLAASITLTIPAGVNSWPIHTIEVAIGEANEAVSKWNPQATAVVLTNIALSNGGALRTMRRRALTGLVFGDSITEGQHNLKSGSAAGTADATLTYAYQLAEMIGAEVGVVGFGAQSWDKTGNGGVPGFMTAYSSLWGGGPARSFAGLDFIVINHGQNATNADAATIGSFLAGLLALCDPKTRIYVMRPLKGTNAALVSSAVAAAGNKRIQYVDTTGWWSTADAGDAVHPWGYTSLESIAPRLAAVVRTPRRFSRDADGSAVPLTSL